MRFLILMIRTYPGRSLFTLCAMFFAGLAEGFGLSAMLPLLSIATGSQAGVGQITPESASAGNSTAERMVKEAFELIGIEPTLELLLLFVLCAILLKSVLVLVANKHIGYTVAQIETDLRLDLLRALIASRWEFHLQQPVGTLANSMTTEALRSSKAYQSGMVMAIASIHAIVYIGVAILVSWKATFAGLLAGLIIFYALRGLVRKARRAGERQTKLFKSLVGHLVDSLQSIKPLKAMALEDLAESVLSRETNKLNTALRKQIISREYLRAFQEPLRFIFLLVGLYAALVYLHLPLATLMVLLFLVGRILIQLGKIQEQYQKMVTWESGFWEIQDKIREAQKAKEGSLGSQPPVLDKSIHMDRVLFAYGQTQVLQDVSISFPAGKITAIVGPSGSGKTTIVDLLIGLIRPQSGEIWIDDIPLAKIDLRKWRQSVGYVPQEMWLLHDTVLNNVTLGDPELNKEDAEYALRAAGSWEFVQKLPHGINSTVGERGSKISGGQRQRIAIARALVHKPQVLILDEATTALDPENESAICATLRRLRGEITILAISHQPAILEVADQAYRLQNGAAVPVAEADLTNSLDPKKGEIVADQKSQLLAKSTNVS